jgi:hypothetical protein
MAMHLVNGTSSLAQTLPVEMSTTKANRTHNLRDLRMSITATTRRSLRLIQLALFQLVAIVTRM